MTASPFAAIVPRLIDRARLLGEATAKARRDPTRAWRDARLVWPLFTKG
ncbi:MAG TPA: hypothetical protein PK680_02800 [Novosphingobium sp.]|nr:hypothetical protein [Novosphingobium sp.]HQA17292.1 hypothetical protein [Novosphingobium sp.]